MFSLILISGFLPLFAEIASTGSPPTIIYLLGTFIAGGGLAAIYNLWRRWRKGHIEDTELINRITQETIKGADDILAQYRLEVEVVKRQVEDYRQQLHTLTQELSAATVRIVALEYELKTTNGERERLLRELALVKEERTHLQHEISFLSQKIDFLLTNKESVV